MLFLGLKHWINQNSSAEFRDNGGTHYLNKAALEIRVKNVFCPESARGLKVLAEYEQAQQDLALDI